MKLFSALFTSVVMLLSSPAMAEFKPFAKDQFEAALASGHTVVVDFHASWCPTCRKQAPILNEIVKMKGYENVVAFKADFDKEKELKKTMNVSKQSTIVVFKGGQEVGRSTGSTSKEDLKQLIDKGL